MAKRMIDTELWNNEDIIENFTAEDRYFWLYLLTSPHNTICGILKYSPALIARDMGLHKDTIINLVYRFENIHKLIVTDKETNEILILNWGKFNWTKSPKIATLLTKELQAVKSSAIRDLLVEKMQKFLGKEDTVSIGYVYPSNTITNTNINTNIVIVSIEDINTWFDKVYSIYPRKVSKIQAKNTFTKKLQGMEREEAHRQAVAIYQLLERQNEAWKSENDGDGRKLEYIPYFSTWLNQNAPDSPHGKGKRK